MVCGNSASGFSRQAFGSSVICFSKKDAQRSSLVLYGNLLMLAQRRLSEKEHSMLFAHRANIERYERILQTALTAHERAFVKRRLAEERAALDQLSGTRDKPDLEFART